VFPDDSSLGSKLNITEVRGVAVWHAKEEQFLAATGQPHSVANPNLNKGLLLQPASCSLFHCFEEIDKERDCEKHI
jgi:hypothetical protein